MVSGGAASRNRRFSMDCGLTCVRQLHSVHSMKTNLSIPLWLILLLPLPLHAIDVPGLYETEVPVLDQQAESRRMALRAALQIVLVKLTGDRLAPQRAALGGIMRTPASYVQQYRYKAVNKLTHTVGGQAGAELQLWVRFDSTALNNKLRQLGMPVWGKERPSTLIWLALQDETGRHLAGMEEHADIMEVVNKRAARRGIALLAPLLDLDDTLRLRASDVWGGFQGPVLAASERYQADAILTGSIISTAPGIWAGRWLAYLAGQTHTWSTEGGPRDAVLDAGIDGLADRLVARFMRSDSGSGVHTISLSVSRIASTEQYAKTLKYLESLSPVVEVQVTEVIPDEVTFLLTAHGGELAVAQAIALGSTLATLTTAEAAYRLLP